MKQVKASFRFCITKDYFLVIYLDALFYLISIYKIVLRILQF